MTVTLANDLEELINERVRSGAYESVDQVVTESLRLLLAREQGRDALRQEIMRGFDDIQQGRFSTYSTDDDFDALADKIARPVTSGPA